MAMTVACLDGQQYPRQLSFGQMSGGGGGYLGKRKRPGSRSGLTTGQVKVNGFPNQWSMSAVKGEEIASVRKISLTKPDASLLFSTTASGSPIKMVGSTTTIHINPFRSTDTPSSPKSRRRRIASVKQTTYTRESATSTVVTMTTPSLEEQEHGHEVEDTDLGLVSSLTTDDDTPPSTSTNLSPEHVLQVSAAALPTINSTKLSRTSEHPLLPSSTLTSTESLKPCHICHSRPRQKSDLHKYIDCTRCTHRVCCVCARECAGVDCRARLVCSGCCVEDHGRRDRDVEDASGDGGEVESAGTVLCLDCFGDQ